MTKVLVYMAVIYVSLGILYVAGLWACALNRHDPCSGQCRREAARMTLGFPFWGPILGLQILWRLLRQAELIPKPRIGKELCPECRKKLVKGPHR